MSSFDDQVKDIETELGGVLSDVYVRFLRSHQEAVRDDGLVLYQLDQLKERNSTLQVQKYRHDFLAVGDDSGGRLVILRFSDPLAMPVLVDGGALVPNLPSQLVIALSDSWQSWEAAGFPLP